SQPAPKSPRSRIRTRPTRQKVRTRRHRSPAAAAVAATGALDAVPRPLVPVNRATSRHVTQCVCIEIHAHPQRSLARLRGVTVDFGIFPSVTEVALIRVEHREPAVDEDPEPLRWLGVMLVDLGKSLG